MSDRDLPKEPSESQAEAHTETCRVAELAPLTLDSPLAVTEPIDPLRAIRDRPTLAVDKGLPPDLLDFGGEEAFERYREVFNHLYYPRQPITDPQGRVIIFEEDYCRHVCYCEDRFDKRRRRAGQEARVRDYWDQSRAGHILWILPALLTPSLIVHNNQQEGNLVYLLGYPAGDLNHPGHRFYASVRPTHPQAKRVTFKTAYTIKQEQWDRARRAPEHRRSQPHVLYRCPTPRW
jgi:hypothetical protein